MTSEVETAEAVYAGWPRETSSGCSSSLIRRA